MLNFCGSFFGESGEVVVVGEDEDLGFLTEFFEDREEGASSVVIECHEEVVQDKGDGRVFIKVKVDRG